MKKRPTTLKREIKNGKANITEVMKSKRTGHYEIQDPSEFLIATIGASFFNEPGYFSVFEEQKNASGKLTGYTYSTDDLDENACKIIDAAIQVAESESPKDLLQIAHWARTEMRLRTTPQILLAVAAEHTRTKPFVRKYCSKVIQRPDEIRQVFAAYRHLFGTDKMLPSCLKRGLADAFTKFDEASLMKYDTKDHPTFADVLRMVDRKAGWPLNKSMDHYLKTGDILNATEIPIVAARKALNKCTEFGKEAKALAKQSRANWEVLKSAFPTHGKEVWEHLVKHNQLPYMAMLRNLRNLLDEGVSEQTINLTAKALVEKATKSKQLPFRFLAAYKAIGGKFTHSPYWGDSETPVGNKKHRETLKTAIEDAIDEIAGTLAKLPGRTLVAVDTSGSMHSPVSGKSEMSCMEAAIILGAIVAKNSSEGSILGAFANYFKPAFAGELQDKKVMSLAEAISKMNVGGGTSAEQIITWALQQGKKFDRIIILSDMQTYNSSGAFWFGGYPQKKAKTVAELMKVYRTKVNKDCKLHSFDLRGLGGSLTAQGDLQSNLIAGFSEQALKQILEFEGITETGEETEQVFTIEYIRKNF